MSGRSDYTVYSDNRLRHRRSGHRLKTLRNGIGNAISISITSHVPSSFRMNFIKFARALLEGRIRVK